MEERINQLEKVRIGDSCFYDAISALLEFDKKLYWAMEYTDYKFFYNRKSFISFENALDLDKHISDKDKYYFVERPESVYRNDLSNYSLKRYLKNVDEMLVYETIDKMEFFEWFNSLSRVKIPFILEVNTNAYRDFYKQPGWTVPQSDCQHLINIFDINTHFERTGLLPGTSLGVHVLNLGRERLTLPRFDYAF